MPEIEARHATLTCRGGPRGPRKFLLSGREEAVETFDGMPARFRYLSETERAQLAKQMCEQQLKVGEQQLEESKVALKRNRADDLIQSYRNVRDSVTVLTRQDLVAKNVLVVAMPLLHDSTKPSHELDPEQSKETGIVMSSKIGVRVPPKKSGAIQGCS